MRRTSAHPGTASSAILSMCVCGPPEKIRLDTGGDFETWLSGLERDDAGSGGGGHGRVLGGRGCFPDRPDVVRWRCGGERAGVRAVAAERGVPHGAGGGGRRHHLG